MSPGADPSPSSSPSRGPIRFRGELPRPGIRLGKVLERGLMAGVVIWLLFVVLTAMLWDSNGQQYESGGLPTAESPGLHQYLRDQGFVPCPFPAAQTAAHSLIPVSTLKPATLETKRYQECFRGRYHGSQPIYVSIGVQPANANGLWVQVDYTYSGFKWRANDSDKKVQQFTDALRDWIDRQQQLSLNNVTR